MVVPKTSNSGTTNGVEELSSIIESDVNSISRNTNRWTPWGSVKKRGRLKRRPFKRRCHLRTVEEA